MINTKAVEKLMQVRDELLFYESYEDFWSRCKSGYLMFYVIEISGNSRNIALVFNWLISQISHLVENETIKEGIVLYNDFCNGKATYDDIKYFFKTKLEPIWSELEKEKTESNVAGTSICLVFSTPEYPSFSTYHFESLLSDKFSSSREKEAYEFQKKFADGIRKIFPKPPKINLINWLYTQDWKED